MDRGRRNHLSPFIRMQTSLLHAYVVCVHVCCAVLCCASLAGGVYALSLSALASASSSTSSVVLLSSASQCPSASRVQHVAPRQVLAQCGPELHVRINYTSDSNTTTETFTTHPITSFVFDGATDTLFGAHALLGVVRVVGAGGALESLTSSAQCARAFSVVFDADSGLVYAVCSTQLIAVRVRAADRESVGESPGGAPGTVTQLFDTGAHCMYPVEMKMFHDADSGKVFTQCMGHGQAQHARRTHAAKLASERAV